MKEDTGFYSIRQVIELTGVTEFLLRTWEYRYGAFRPKRTPTGRRLYSSDDILRARALLILSRGGHRIHDIADLPLKDLQKKLDDSLTAQPALAPAETPAAIKKAISKAKKFQWDEVQSSFFLERENTPPTAWIYGFLLPLISEVNREIGMGRFSISQEHIITALAKEQLGALKIEMKKRSKKRNSKIRLVFAAPEGDYHDLGLMIGSCLAESFGIKNLFLGSNVPKRDLSESCLRFKATHLVLTSTASPENGAKDETPQFLHFLDRNLPPRVSLWVAGPNVRNLNLKMERDFKVLNSFQSFEKELKNV